MTDLAFRFSSASTVGHSLLSAASCAFFGDRRPVAYQSIALTIRADRPFGGQSNCGPKRRDRRFSMRI